MINFRKKKKKDWFNKNPNSEKFWKSPLNAWVYVWKHENKCKREGIRVLLALGEKNLAKSLGKNNKKSSVEPCQVGERERGKFEKVWNSPIWVLKKLDSRVSIDRKIVSINRYRQRLNNTI